MSKDLNKFRTEAEGRECIKKTVNIAEVSITGEFQIEYNGIKLTVEKQAVSDFLKILGVSQVLMNKFDESTKQRLTKFIQSAFIAGGKGMMVTLVFNPRTKTVVRMLKESSILTSETFFGLAEKMIDKYGLQIQETHIMHDGSPVIQLVSKQNQFDVNKDHKEAFYPGLSLFNDLEKGTYLTSYMHRLTCTNGMSTPSFDGGPINFDGTGGAGAAMNFFEQVNQLAARQFIPANFQDKVRSAQNTFASVAELNFGADIIKNYGSNMTDEQVSQFVPIEQVKWGFAKLKVNVKEMNSAQQKTAITNVKVWDVINGITDFASHNYGFNVSSQGTLGCQIKANELLAKKSFDTQNLTLVRL